MNDDTIKKIYVELTSTCNMNCSICFRNSWINEEKAMMSNSLINNINKSLYGQSSVEKIVFAGMGEPLLHGRIFDMVKNASDLKVKTEIITNGSLLSADTSDRLIENGLNRMWISVDDSHLQNIEFGDIAENIGYFNSVRGDKCALGFTYVLVNPILEDLKRIEDFSKKYSADKVNISQLVPCNLIPDLKYNPDIPIGIMNTEDIFKPMERKLNYCPFVEENSVFIKHNGDISPCMQLLHSSYTYLYDEKRIVTAYSFGNMLCSNLFDVWNSDEYINFRRRVRNFEFADCTLCDGCDDRKENKTDCMYNSMPTCGACLWAQSIARCP